MESSVNVTPRERSTRKPKHVTSHVIAQTTHVCRNTTWICIVMSHPRDSYTFHVSSKSVQERRGHVGVTKFAHSHYFTIGCYKSLYYRTNRDITFSWRWSGWSRWHVGAFCCHWVRPKQKRVCVLCKTMESWRIIIHLSAAARSVQMRVRTYYPI